MIQSTAPEAPAASTSTAKRLRNSTKAVQQKKAKTKKAPVDSTFALEIITAAHELGIARDFGHENRPSCVIRIPAWADFKKTLPAGARGKEMAQTFHALGEAVTVLCGESKSTWVIHRSGSFALYGSLRG